LGRTNYEQLLLLFAVRFDLMAKFYGLLFVRYALWYGQTMRDSWFKHMTVQNSQFSIHIRFANNANGHIRQICIRRLIFMLIR